MREGDSRPPKVPNTSRVLQPPRAAAACRIGDLVRAPACAATAASMSFSCRRRSSGRAGASPQSRTVVVVLQVVVIVVVVLHGLVIVAALAVVARHAREVVEAPTR